MNVMINIHYRHVFTMLRNFGYSFCETIVLIAHAKDQPYAMVKIRTARRINRIEKGHWG